MWLVEGRTIDHSTFCDLRTKFKLDRKKDIRAACSPGRDPQRVHQGCVGASAIPVARVGQGSQRMVMGLYGLQSKKADDRDRETARLRFARTRLRDSENPRAGKNEVSIATRSSIRHEPVESRRDDEPMQIAQRREPGGTCSSLLYISE